MAVIKSGQSSDQASVDATSKALRVTLYDANGNANSVPLATSPTGALETGGNVQLQMQLNRDQQIPLLQAILVELRILNFQIASMNNTPDADADIEALRTDRAFANTNS